MRPNSSPAHLVLGLLAALLLVGLAATAQAQERIQGDVLGNESSLIGFPSAEDTVTEEFDERPAKRRAELQGAPLRGENTLSTTGDERRDYLLGLTASGAIGIDGDVRDRYANGNLENATLTLSYTGGCDSPSGELTVRAIENRSWSPFDVAWSDTTRAPNGTLEVQGSILAQVPVSANNADPDVGCDQATIDLATDPVARILAGQTGGIAMFWTGEQRLNVSTLDADEAPSLDVNFTTNGPSVHEVTIDQGFPAAAETGHRISIVVNASDPQTLPDDGVRLNLTPEDDPANATTVEATRSSGLFVARHTFPHDAEGLYDVEAVATDADGWTANATPSGEGPHLAADGTPPEIRNASLAGAEANTTATGRQGEALNLTADVSDLSCELNRTTCGEWQVTWRDSTLANGSLDPEQRIDAEVPLPRPGNTTARLVVEDAAGHVNRSTNWTLVIEDTHEPSAQPLDGSHLAPGQAATIENGTPIQLAFAIEDDLPVDPRLQLQGTQAVERDLPSHDAEGIVDTELTDLPEGTYQARLVLDDGTHTRSIAFGELTIAPRGAPSITIDRAGDRVGPDDTVHISVRDRDLAATKTTVTATVNGLETQPEVETETVENGQDLAVQLANRSHGDLVNLTVRAQDTQGLSSTGRVHLTVDAQPPELTEPADETWVQPGDTVVFDAEDPGDGRITVSIDADTSQISASPPRRVSADRLAASPGNLTPIEVTVGDDLGNEQTRTVHVGIDEDPPQASTTFTHDGLVVLAEDRASGVLRVDAHASVNGDALEEVEVFQESPTRFFVATGPLTRGDEIELVAEARDHVGHRVSLGTFEDPLELTVPDRAPSVAIERTSPSVGAEGEINWTASDPDDDPINVTLRIETPSGAVSEDTVAKFGTQRIEPEEVGRHEVTVQATSAGSTTEASTFFYLAPEGRLSQASGVPDRIDPGEQLVVELSFPTTPQEVFVTAVDETNSSTSARVDLEGDRATATFDRLPEGDYDILATVVHEEGAVERSHVASVQSQQPLGQRLADLVVPLLIVLAILLVVAIAVLWYRQREEEDEEAEADRDAARP